MIRPLKAATFPGSQTIIFWQKKVFRIFFHRGQKRFGKFFNKHAKAKKNFEWQKPRSRKRRSFFFLTLKHERSCWDSIPESPVKCHYSSQYPCDVENRCDDFCPTRQLVFRGSLQLTPIENVIWQSLSCSRQSPWSVCV